MLARQPVHHRLQRAEPHAGAAAAAARAALSDRRHRRRRVPLFLVLRPAARRAIERRARRRADAARPCARRRCPRSPGSSPSGPAFTGMALLSWRRSAGSLPFDSGLLDFSEAETQFLFPAPVSRRQLLMHRMLRSQLGLLFGAVVLGVAVPSVSGVRPAVAGSAMWLLLVTGKVYYTGVSLARARIGAASARERRLAWLAPAVVACGGGDRGDRADAGVPRRAALGISRPRCSLVGDVSLQPLPHIVLWPFMALTRPVFATLGRRVSHGARRVGGGARGHRRCGC